MWISALSAGCHYRSHWIHDMRVYEGKPTIISLFLRVWYKSKQSYFSFGQCIIQLKPAQHHMIKWQSVKLSLYVNLRFCQWHGALKLMFTIVLHYCVKQYCNINLYACKTECIHPFSSMLSKLGGLTVEILRNKVVYISMSFYSCTVK